MNVQVPFFMLEGPAEISHRLMFLLSVRMDERVEHGVQPCRWGRADSVQGHRHIHANTDTIKHPCYANTHTHTQPRKIQSRTMIHTDTHTKKTHSSRNRTCTRTLMTDVFLSDIMKRTGVPSRRGSQRTWACGKDNTPRAK